MHIQRLLNVRYSACAHTPKEKKKNAGAQDLSYIFQNKGHEEGEDNTDRFVSPLLLTSSVLLGVMRRLKIHFLIYKAGAKFSLVILTICKFNASVHSPL